MKFFPRVLLSVLVLVIAHPGFAQVDEQTDEAEQLKLAALEALMQAPSDRALPIARWSTRKPGNYLSRQRIPVAVNCGFRRSE